MAGDIQKFLPKSPLALEIYYYFTSEIDQFDYHLLKRWMKSDNIEALAVVYGIITEEAYFLKISPKLNAWDYFDFIIKYFSKCLVLDCQDYWIHSRFQSGMDLRNWFATFWEDNDVPREIVEKFKKWLSNVYISEDLQVKQCVGNVVLGYLFEDKEIKLFFSDWQKHPVLKEAYSAAVEVNE